MTRRAVAAAVLLLAAGVVASPARAQSSWDAALDITPYPSPYLSDWEANPTIATLTITNPAADQNVLLVYRVTDQGGRVVASGRSDPMLIVSGPPTVITDFVNLPGSSQHDQGFEDQMRRTGRLPEGDQTICVAVTDEGGFVLAEDCVTFSVVYPDPPYLIGPLDDQALTSSNPVFQWTPLQVPPAFQLTYVLRISEVLAGQTSEQALVANIPLFETTTYGTNFEYPIGAPPLEGGKFYVWRVQALDQNGYAASANEGRSEIWAFRSEGTTLVPRNEPPATPSAAILLVRNAYPTGSWQLPDFDDVCTGWDSATPNATPLVDTVDIWSPVGFPPSAEVTAAVYRHEITAGGRRWAIVGEDTDRGRLYMLFGDCDGPPGSESGLHWIAVRRTSAVEVDFLMSADTTPPATYTPQQERELEFGVVILSLRGQTVAAPADFDAVDTYLEGHAIDVLAGVNLFGVYRLVEREWWAYFRDWFGYDEKEIELQGFFGFDQSLTGGLVVGADAGVDVSAEQKFLVLRAALPERKPKYLLADRVESMRLGLEISLGDTITLGTATRKAAVDLIVKVTHTIVVNDDVTLVGSLGLDFNTERSGGNTTQKIDLVFTYGAKAALRGEKGWWIGNPVLEIHHRLTTEWEQSAAIAGEFGWDEWTLGKVSVSVSRKWEEAEPKVAEARAAAARAVTWAEQAQRDVDVTRRQVEGLRTKLMAAKARLTGLGASETRTCGADDVCMRQDSARREADEAVRSANQHLAEAQESLRAAEDRLKTATSEQGATNREASRVASQSSKPGQWKREWKLRLAVGTMSFLDLLDLARRLGVSVDSP